MTWVTSFFSEKYEFFKLEKVVQREEHKKWALKQVCYSEKYQFLKVIWF